MPGGECYGLLGTLLYNKEVVRLTRMIAILQCIFQNVLKFVSWRNSYPYLTVVVSCSRWSRAGLPIWHVWSQILKFKLFLTQLAFFENQKFQSKSVFSFFFFFCLKGLALAKYCLSCISIINIFWRESMARQGAKNIAKILLLSKIFNAINKKQMYDSLFIGKENASKKWNCILSMFLTSFNIYICLA